MSVSRRQVCDVQSARHGGFTRLSCWQYGTRRKRSSRVEDVLYTGCYLNLIRSEAPDIASRHFGDVTALYRIAIPISLAASSQIAQRSVHWSSIDLRRFDLSAARHRGSPPAIDRGEGAISQAGKGVMMPRGWVA